MSDRIIKIFYEDGALRNLIYFKNNKLFKVRRFGKEGREFCKDRDKFEFYEYTIRKNELHYYYDGFGFHAKYKIHSNSCFEKERVVVLTKNRFRIFYGKWYFYLSWIGRHYIQRDLFYIKLNSGFKDFIYIRGIN